MNLMIHGGNSDFVTLQKDMRILPAALLDSPDKLWDSVSKMKDGLGGHKFDIISQFMKSMIVSFPHSSALKSI